HATHTWADTGSSSVPPGPLTITSPIAVIRAAVRVSLPHLLHSTISPPRFLSDTGMVATSVPAAGSIATARDFRLPAWRSAQMPGAVPKRAARPSLMYDDHLLESIPFKKGVWGSPPGIFVSAGGQDLCVPPGSYAAGGQRYVEGGPS